MLRLAEAVPIIGMVRSRLFVSCGSDRRPSGPRPAASGLAGLGRAAQCSPRVRARSSPLRRGAAHSMANARSRIPRPSSPTNRQLSGELHLADGSCPWGARPTFLFCPGSKARSVDPNEQTYRHCDRPGERVPEPATHGAPHPCTGRSFACDGRQLSAPPLHLRSSNRFVVAAALWKTRRASFGRARKSHGSTSNTTMNLNVCHEGSAGWPDRSLLTRTWPGTRTAGWRRPRT